MKQNWDRAIQHCLTWEGGFADRSGPQYPHPEYVNHGITLSTFRVYHPESTKDTIKNMTVDRAKQFYSETFRQEISFDTLESGLDVVMLHGAIMMGVNGIHSLNVIAKDDWAYLLVLQMQKKMHREQSDWHYMAGWSDRYRAIYELAKELAGTT